MLKNVSPGLIENVKDLKISLNELTVYDFDVYSSIEVYYKIAHKLNDIIRELSRFEGVLSEEVIKQNEKLIYLLGEGLENEVISEINRLIYKGFFENLVNINLFNDLETSVDIKINNMRNEINNVILENGDSNLEVVQARKDYDTLNDRLNSYDLLMNVNSYYSDIDYIQHNNMGYYEENGKILSYYSPSYDSYEINVLNVNRIFVSTRLKGDWYGVIFVDNEGSVIKKQLYSNDVKIFNSYFAVPVNAVKVFINSFKIDGDVYKVQCKEQLFKDNIVYSDLEKVKLSQNKKDFKSINRLGYDPYNLQTPPEQSIEGYKRAYKEGFRVMLCNVRTTNDNKLVCLHDKKINNVARNLDGSTIENDVNINDITLNQCNNYDFGILKGDKYKATKILQLEDMIIFCKKSICELYIELKEDLTQEQYSELVKLIKIYGMEDLTTITGDYSQKTCLVAINKLLPNSRFGFICNDVTSNNISFAKTLQNENNEVFLFVWNTTEITKEGIELCLENNIKIEAGTLNSKNDIIEYYSNKNNLFVNRMESEKFIIENVLVESLFNL